MSEDIRVWEVDKEWKTATPMKADNQVETEKKLENMLARNPDMLMPDLTLVGRQTPVGGETEADGGYLDLLGVDADGRLVVFELKPAKLTRKAVAQIIDYCSYLDSLTDMDLADHIAKHSDRDGINKIGNFEEWLYVNRHEKQLASLRPTKMVLVGLGADARARRMVEFLVGKGVDITLLTFNGYRYDRRQFLARTIEDGREAGDVGQGRMPSQTERRSALAERSEELGIADLWQDAINALAIASKGSATMSGITFSLPRITLPDNVNVYGSHSVVINPSGKIQVTFYPAAVDVCLEKFKAKKAEIGFELEAPPNTPTTKRVPEQWYCLLNKEAWAQKKQTLIELAENVHDEWQKIRRAGGTKT